MLGLGYRFNQYFMLMVEQSAGFIYYYGESINSIFRNARQTLGNVIEGRRNTYGASYLGGQFFIPVTDRFSIPIKLGAGVVYGRGIAVPTPQAQVAFSARVGLGFEYLTEVGFQIHVGAMYSVNLISHKEEIRIYKALHHIEPQVLLGWLFYNRNDLPPFFDLVWIYCQIFSSYRKWIIAAILFAAFFYPFRFAYALQAYGSPASLLPIKYFQSRQFREIQNLHF